MLLCRVSWALNLHQIATIGSALQQNKALKISFLSDALRGTRETPDPTTASLLAPLISRFGPDRVQIRMYHTPNLTGLRKKCIPTRINEGWGLQHMKLYGIDDEVILSGYKHHRSCSAKRPGRLIPESKCKPFQRLLYEPCRSLPCLPFDRARRLLLWNPRSSQQHQLRCATCGNSCWLLYDLASREDHSFAAQRSQSLHFFCSRAALTTDGTISSLVPCCEDHVD